MMTIFTVNGPPTPRSPEFQQVDPAFDAIESVYRAGYRLRLAPE